MRLHLLPLALVFSVAISQHSRAQSVTREYFTQQVPVGQVLSARNAKHAEVLPDDLLSLGLSASRASDILQHIAQEPTLSTRGAKDAKLYREYAPSVVLIVTDTALGSGSIIADRTILTNWHVVAGASQVGVVFKPLEEGDKISAADVVVARVVRVDRKSDLALVQVPASVKSPKPLTLATSDEIEVGADVHAIGHPTGEAWTYTRGVISQFRKDFTWKTEDGVEHEADVVQTQTPINPGNSGGPLLSDSGHLLGVNAFKTPGAEGLNFAVSVNDVRRFLSSPVRSANTQERRAASSACQPKVLYEGRDRDNTSYIKVMDIGCTGKPNVVYVVPDDPERSIRLEIDHTASGRADFWIYDSNRDGKWDYSLISSKGDGKIDLIGYHPDGKVTPSRYEPYHGQPTPWAN
jgi:S1-C subfamily serine protease